MHQSFGFPDVVERNLETKMITSMHLCKFKFCLILTTVYRILQIAHGGKLLWMQNKIQFAGKHSQLTVRSI